MKTVELKSKSKSEIPESTPDSTSSPQGSPPALGQLRTVKRTELRGSPTNPRKSFPEATLKELAESLKGQGVQHPLLVRPWPEFCPMKNGAWTVENHKAGKGQFEIVDGERRYRASELAGVKELPIIVKDLTDAQVVEIQLISFLQREDVSALEEGESYRQLIDAKIHTVESLMAKLGRSKADIYGRMALATKLGPKVKTALSAGKVGSAVAGYLTTVPAGLQEKALKEVTEGDRWDPAPMSAREAEQHIEKNYVKSLKDARFDQKDAFLMPTAGICEACPKRNGVKCQDVECFGQKTAAHYKRLEMAAVAKGQRVMSEEEYKKIRYGSAYVELDDECHQLQNGSKTWRTLIKGSDMVPILAKTDKGLIEIVPKAAATEAAKRNKHKFYSSSSGGDAAHRKEQQAKKKQREVMKVVRGQALAQLKRHGICASGIEFWRLLANLALGILSWDDSGALAEHRVLTRGEKLDKMKTDATGLVEGLADKCKTEAELKGLLLETLALNGWMDFYSAEFGDNFQSACKHFKIDLKKMMEQQAKPAPIVGKAKAAKPAAKVGKKKK